jgi:hypothetical protein
MHLQPSDAAIPPSVGQPARHLDTATSLLTTMSLPGGKLAAYPCLLLASRSHSRVHSKTTPESSPQNSNTISAPRSPSHAHRLYTRPCLPSLSFITTITSSSATSQPSSPRSSRHRIPARGTLFVSSTHLHFRPSSASHPPLLLSLNGAATATASFRRLRVDSLTFVFVSASARKEAAKLVADATTKTPLPRVCERPAQRRLFTQAQPPPSACIATHQASPTLIPLAPASAVGLSPTRGQRRLVTQTRSSATAPPGRSSHERQHGPPPLLRVQAGSQNDFLCAHIVALVLALSAIALLLVLIQVDDLTRRIAFIADVTCVWQVRSSEQLYLSRSPTVV